jgi:hypothetical protein
MYCGSVKVVCEYLRCVVDVLWGLKKVESIWKSSRCIVAVLKWFVSIMEV